VKKSTLRHGYSKTFLFFLSDIQRPYLNRRMHKVEIVVSQFTVYLYASLTYVYELSRPYLLLQASIKS
jgi:hypothetical protein